MSCNKTKEQFTQKKSYKIWYILSKKSNVTLKLHWLMDIDYLLVKTSVNTRSCTRNCPNFGNKFDKKSSNFIRGPVLWIILLTRRALGNAPPRTDLDLGSCRPTGKQKSLIHAMVRSSVIFSLPRLTYLQLYVKNSQILKFRCH